MPRLTWPLAPALALTLTTAARAQHDHGAHAPTEPSSKGTATGGAASPSPTTAQTHGGMVMGAGGDTWSTRPAPMLMPIRTMIPGTWALPGALMIMGNVHGLLTNPGFPRAQDRALGRTHPYLVNDWVMARARTGDGWLEGMLMLNFEALSFGKGGWYEVGQAGEGLWDTQHQHQLVHQALLAVHLTGSSDGPFRATVWGGQGSATIGPPLFMHRASNPSPTVPRKHHKGENPHETFPVLGATLQWHGSVLEASVFSATELGRDDSRLYPRVHAPKSVAARFRQMLGESLEFQVSGERLVDQGTEGDAYQASSSLYGRSVGRVVVDWLLDAAIDVPFGPPHGHEGNEPAEQHGAARAILGEVAVRDASLRDIGWTRLELNDRVERNETVSKRWFFGSLGYERVLWVDPASLVGLGLFAEGTLVRVPDSVRTLYGDRWGVTTTVGLHGQLMWMNAAAHGGRGRH